jgi:hypothetical protein
MEALLGFDLDFWDYVTFASMSVIVMGGLGAVDWHLDWGISQFLSKQMFIGAVGYFYQQLTPDSGQSRLLGDFKSRVIGIGPQIGFLFPVGDMQGYLNLKGYGEFAAEKRAAGWNAWVTLAISPADRPAPMARPMIHK